MSALKIVIRANEFDKELRSELSFLGGKITGESKKCYWVEGARAAPAWADCVWNDVQALEVESIADAQKKLRSISKSWKYFGDHLFRRGALIAEKLGSPKSGEVIFPSIMDGRDLPAFTMAASNLIYYSTRINRPTADGSIPFVENRSVPPSRAYLKLWEALTVMGDWPQLGEQAIDLGAAPGSWSWVISELKANVLSIDRAPLDPKILKSKFVQSQQGDAFSVKPVAMDWVFSDVICFPEKLYEYVLTWIDSGLCEKFVCNVKFTGEVDPAVVDKFRKLPNSRVMHLLNAKKEITWMKHPNF